MTRPDTYWIQRKRGTFNLTNLSSVQMVAKSCINIPIPNPLTLVRSSSGHVLWFPSKAEIRSSRLGWRWGLGCYVWILEERQQSMGEWIILSLSLFFSIWTPWNIIDIKELAGILRNERPIITEGKGKWFPSSYPDYKASIVASGSGWDHRGSRKESWKRGCRERAGSQGRAKGWHCML